MRGLVLIAIADRAVAILRLGALPLGLLRVLTVLGLLAVPTLRAQAPSGRCDLQFFSRGSEAARVSAVQQPSGQYNTFLGGGVSARCPAQGITIVADSAENYGDSRIVHLIGNAEYTEPRVRLTARRLTYHQNEEHLHAEGNVNALLPSGTTMVGPVADYYRPVAGIRALARMIAPGRPTIRLVQQDSTGGPPETATVIANTVVLEGDTLVYASGQVELQRPDVTARGDSAVLNSAREFVRLIRNPVIEGKGERGFTLYGDVIDLFAKNRALERVLSKGRARSVSGDVTLTADTLDFRLADRLLQRAFAWGRSRPRAVSSAHDIVADSLDVQMPDQRLREVHALRRAFAQSEADSTRFRTRERDWLRGDTIVAYFDTLAASDSGGVAGGAAGGKGRGESRQPAIRALIALGDARSYYQLAPRDSGAVAPAINYVKGREIRVSFENRQVDDVTVIDEAMGVYLEPSAVNDSSAVGRVVAVAGSDSVARTPARRPAPEVPAGSLALPPPSEPRDTIARATRPAPAVGAPARRAGFTVQVGAFESRAQADGLRESLAARGFETRIFQDARLFKVRVGRFATRTAATQTVSRLQATGLTVFITPSEPQ